MLCWVITGLDPWEWNWNSFRDVFIFDDIDKYRLCHVESTTRIALRYWTAPFDIGSKDLKIWMWISALWIRTRFLLVASFFLLRLESWSLLHRMFILLVVNFNFVDIVCLFVSSKVRLLTCSSSLLDYWNIRYFATWVFDHCRATAFIKVHHNVDSIRR